MQHFLLQQAPLYAHLELLGALETVTHGGEANVERETDHELAVAHVAASLNDVLRLDLESGRVIDLLKVTSEVALVIVLPFDQTAD